jgi:hypothetical protein
VFKRRRLRDNDESRVIPNTMIRATRSANKRLKEETGVDSLTVTNTRARAIIESVLPRFTRATRNTKPRCLHFAPSPTEFQHKYPHHFFCGKCDNLYQKWVIDGADYRCNVDSARYMCEATHQNFIRPTQLKPVSYYLINDDDDDDDDVISIDSYYGDGDDDDDGDGDGDDVNNNNNNNNQGIKKKPN